MYFDSILSHSCSSMYGNLLGSNKWFSMWCRVRGKMSICSTGRTVHVALSIPLCVTQITQNTIRHNVCYSCRFPVLAVNLAVDFSFSLSAHLSIFLLKSQLKGQRLNSSRHANGVWSHDTCSNMEFVSAPATSPLTTINTQWTTIIPPCTFDYGIMLCLVQTQLTLL